MVKDVIDRLKKGSIKDVALFGNSPKVPGLPQVVVKPEAGIINGTRSYKIIVRHEVGRFDELEGYVLGELDGLLAGDIEGRDGGRYRLHPNGFTDLTADPKNGCIYMERIYIAPMPGLIRQ